MTRSPSRLRPVLLSLLAAPAAVATAQAQDYNTITAINLFTATCVHYLAEPDAIRAAAKEQKFKPLSDPTLLATVVGNATPRGNAWQLPSNTTRTFTLSLRGGPQQTCAVWIEAGNVGDLEAEFRKLVNGAAREGIEVTTESDETLPTRSGKGRMLTMSATDTEQGKGYLFTFLAGDQPGTLFSGAPVQISLQMDRVGVEKRPKKAPEPKAPAQKDAPKASEGKPPEKK